ncbi:MAG: hypothetical protein MJB57_01260 [Gemmatimonadetes bacterium]|nr:hypothetical protein [Gemmatimonadota bacterium]
MGTNDDELFSMEDLEKDLKKGRGGRRWLWFLIGLGVGVGGAIAAPIYLAPYLPSGFGGGPMEILSGPVLEERESEGRLLLTIAAEPGALIASFSRRVDEIGMLVDPGDVVTIAVPDYEPFVEDPDFEGVVKGGAEGDDTAAGGGAPSADEMTDDAAIGGNGNETASADDGGADPEDEAAADEAESVGAAAADTTVAGRG